MKVRCPQCKHINSTSESVVEFKCAKCATLIAALKNKNKIKCPKCKNINYVDKDIKDFVCDRCFETLTTNPDCKCSYKNGSCVKCGKKCNCDFLNQECRICGLVCDCVYDVKGYCITCKDDMFKAFPDKSYYICPRCGGTDVYEGNERVRTKGPTLYRAIPGSDGMYQSYSENNEKIVSTLKCKNCCEILSSKNYIPSQDELRRKRKNKYNKRFYLKTAAIAIIIAIITAIIIN